MNSFFPFLSSKSEQDKENHASANQPTVPNIFTCSFPTQNQNFDETPDHNWSNSTEQAFKIELDEKSHQIQLKTQPTSQIQPNHTAPINLQHANLSVSQSLPLHHTSEIGRQRAATSHLVSNASQKSGLAANTAPASTTASVSSTSQNLTSKFEITTDGKSISLKTSNNSIFKQTPGFDFPDEEDNTWGHQVSQNSQASNNATENKFDMFGDVPF